MERQERKQGKVTLPKGSVVYISAPITSTDIFKTKIRFDETCDRLLRAGLVPINPLSLDDHVANPGIYSEYMRVDYAALTAADAILVLPGWQHSIGCAREVRIATECGILVVFDEGRLGLDI